jgi:hypothetical protein
MFFDRFYLLKKKRLILKKFLKKLILKYKSKIVFNKKKKLTNIVNYKQLKILIFLRFFLYKTLGKNFKKIERNLKKIRL